MFLETIFMFGFLVMALSTVYLYFERKNLRSTYAKAQKEHAREVFELTVLSEVSDKIGYSLSSRDIASTIAVTAVKLFHVTSVSFATFESERIELNTLTYEKVGESYENAVREIVLKGIYNIDEKLEGLHIVEKREDYAQKDATDMSAAITNAPQSYFNIPLVLNNRFTGIITITSKQPKAYQEDDMSMMYKIVNRAQLAIGRLEDVIENERGKVDAMVKSLSSGAIFITLHEAKLTLFTINSAAKRFLELKNQNPDLITVLSCFKMEPNIVTEMKNVILQKKSTFYRNIPIGNLKFNIYLTPVFTSSMDQVTGVALTMQDVTREHEIEKIRESFTNMMVHELRTPLTAIKGAVGLLVDGSLEEEDRERMRLIIKNSTDRLLSDVTDILDSAKIDAGKLSVVKISANINDVVKKATEEMSYAAKSRAILIENHLDTTLDHFDFDPVRIGQVVSNMLSNAVKFSNEGGTVKVYTRRYGESIEVEVADTGAGVSEEKKHSLFKPFSQANFDKRANGTGLGLYISKNIVESHGGDMWIDSKEGEGAHVFFTLPVVAAKEEKLSPPQATAAN